MPIRLNLYHEVQKQAALKRRDPLKLSMFGIGAIAVCFAGYYAVQLGRSISLHSQLSSLKAEYEKLDPQAQSAKKHEDELIAQIKLNDAVQRRIEDRFYWAPLLDEVRQVVPREVQLTKISGDVTGDVVRKCSLTVDGVSAGADPRQISEDLRTAIADRLGTKYRNVISNFKALDDGAEQIPLDGKQLPTATFAINVAFNWGDDPNAAPAAAPKKKR